MKDIRRSSPHRPCPLSSRDRDRERARSNADRSESRRHSVEVGEIASHGLALSRPRRGFESRWGHQNRFLEVAEDGSNCR